MEAEYVTWLTETTGSLWRVPCKATTASKKERGTAKQFSCEKFHHVRRQSCSDDMLDELYHCKVAGPTGFRTRSRRVTQTEWHSTTFDVNFRPKSESYDSGPYCCRSYASFGSSHSREVAALVAAECLRRLRDSTLRHPKTGPTRIFPRPNPKLIDILTQCDFLLAACGCGALECLDVRFVA